MASEEKEWNEEGWVKGRTAGWEDLFLCGLVRDLLSEERKVELVVKGAVENAREHGRQHASGPPEFV